MARRIISIVVYVDLIIIGITMAMFQLVAYPADLPPEVKGLVSGFSKFAAAGFTLIAAASLFSLVNEGIRKHADTIPNGKRFLVAAYAGLALGIVCGGYMLFKALALNFLILLPSAILLLTVNLYALIRFRILFKKDKAKG